MLACVEAQGHLSGQGPYFGGTPDPMSPTDIALVSNDWTILPASVNVRPRVFPRWQYWRARSGVQLPAPFLACDSFSFVCEVDSVKVLDGAAEIGSWQDWTDGIAEEFIDCPSFPHGWALKVSSESVDNFARESNATLGWICELKVLHREHDYEPFREFSIYQVLGTTNLVLPA